MYHYQHLARVVMSVTALLWTTASLGQMRNGEAVAGDLTTEDLIAGVQSRAQRLATSSWRFSEEEGPLEPLGPAVRIREMQVIRSSGGRLRFTNNETVIKKDGKRSSTFDYAWDGSRLTTLMDEPALAPDRRWRGLIAADRGTSGGQLLWRWFIEDATPCADEPLTELLRRGKWVIVGPRDIGGFRAWGLRNAEPLKELEHVTLEVWFIPDHDFVPVEFSADFDPPKGAYQHVRDVEIERQDDMWVMKNARILVVNPLVPRGYAAGNLLVYHLKAFTRSVDPEKSVFSLKFPVGTGAWDDIGKTSFIAGIAVEFTRPDGTHWYAPIDRFPQYKAITDYARGLTPEEWKRTERSRQVEASLVDAPSDAPPPPTTADK
ncbi:hypothetical protein [Fontivita pretiosa]|uniref:hypothetical protein n=1 Tax=Fontivita pretiosa TaxID=2989684 RepID=UPI003D17CEBF